MSKHFYSAVLISLLLLGLTFITLHQNQPARAAFDSIIIDDFTTNQGLLTTGGVTGTASSTASGRTIQIQSGGISGTTALVSGGVLSHTVDVSTTASLLATWGSAALGDVTNGGVNDAFLIQLDQVDITTTMTITVYSGANSSVLSIVVPPISSATEYIIPYSDLVGTVADFGTVTALDLGFDSSTTSTPQAIVLALLQTTSLADITKADALFTDADGSSNVSPGDTLEYTVVMTNAADTYAADLPTTIFTSAAPPNTTLEVGSVTTICSGGTDSSSVTTGNTAGDTSVAVNLDTLEDGETCTVTFRVVIDNPLPAGVIDITCQGSLDYQQRTTALDTDALSTTATTGDANITPVTAAPNLAATLTAAIQDLDGDGQADPGEVIFYTAIITNYGNIAETNVAYVTPAHSFTTLNVGSVTGSCLGTVVVGNNAGDDSVNVAIGTLAGGSTSCIITFGITVGALPVGSPAVICHGTLTGSNTPALTTNSTSTSNDTASVNATATAIASNATATAVAAANTGGSKGSDDDDDDGDDDDDDGQNNAPAPAPAPTFTPVVQSLASNTTTAGTGTSASDTTTTDTSTTASAELPVSLLPQTGYQPLVLNTLLNGGLIVGVMLIMGLGSVLWYMERRDKS